MNDMLNESYEDYLKTIYLISKRNKAGWVSNSEISEFLKITPSSVTNMLYKLRKKDCIIWQPRKRIRLTQKGKIIAQDIICNYKTLQYFFKNVLCIEDSLIIDNLSGKLEHLITPQVLESLRNLNMEFIEV